MDFLKSLTQVAKDTGRIAVWGSSTIVASAVKKAPAIVEKIHEFANKTEERGTHDYNTYLKNRKAGEAAQSASQSAAQPAPQKAEEPAPQKAEEPAPEAKEPIQAKPEPKDEPEIKPASEQMIEIQAEAKAEEKPAEPAAAEVKPAEKAKETKAKKK